MVSCFQRKFDNRCLAPPSGCQPRAEINPGALRVKLPLNTDGFFGPERITLFVADDTDSAADCCRSRHDARRAPRFSRRPDSPTGRRRLVTRFTSPTRSGRASASLSVTITSLSPGAATYHPGRSPQATRMPHGPPNSNSTRTGRESESLHHVPRPRRGLSSSTRAGP